MRALPGDDDRMQRLYAARGSSYPTANDMHRIGLVLHHTSEEQLAEAERRGLDIVVRGPSGEKISTVDHEELPMVRALIDEAERQGKGVVRESEVVAREMDLAERLVHALRWATLDEVDEAMRGGTDLVVRDETDRELAFINHSELSLVRDVLACSLADPAAFPPGLRSRVEESM